MCPEKSLRARTKINIAPKKPSNNVRPLIGCCDKAGRYLSLVNVFVIFSSRRRNEISIGEQSMPTAVIDAVKIRYTDP